MQQYDFGSRKLVINTFLEFLEDGKPHSLREFEDYLADRNIKNITQGQYNNAIHFMIDKGSIKRVARGVYAIGTRDNKEVNIVSEENEVKRLLMRVKRELSSPINIISLSESDRKLILDIQHMYEECNRLIKKIDEGGEQ